MISKKVHGPLLIRMSFLQSYSSVLLQHMTEMDLAMRY